MKKTLHQHGIHCTTVETEYEDASIKLSSSSMGDIPDETTCLLGCETKSCETQFCYPKEK